MKSLKSWKTALAFFGVAVLLYYFAASGRRSVKEDLPPPAPELSLPDLAGKKTSLADFKGQVVLLDFWATWCEPCTEELPDLKVLRKKYKDRGFEIVAVSMDVLGRRIVAPFIKNNRVDYPILLSGGMTPDGYFLPGLPTAFLIDRRGLIVRKYIGPMSYEDLARDVEEALAH